ncbi:ChaB family protein [Prescottella sp. D32]|uniref:ChaB family protein n=1 Tax=Prescottella sp. D32 TaxID=3029740 RepID=UPI003078EC64
MPKTTKTGQPKKQELPATLLRSPAKAQRTFANVHDSAVEEYGEGERAHRVAYAALKHSFEKVGDHWEPKAEKGPSDARARSGGPQASGRTAEGVDANASRRHLYDIARKLDIHGRSTMNKGELVDAIEKENRRRSAAARS